MRAAVYEGPEQMVVRDVPDPACPDDGFVLRVDACTICGTDVRIYRHGKSNVKCPIILGHEIAGTVVQKGPAVQGIAEGDRFVVAPPGIGCGQCAFCRTGETNLCGHKQVLGYHLNGGFAQYVAIPGQAIQMGNVLPIPPSLGAAEVAITEPLACVVHAQRAIQTGPGDTVVILGAGPIGCMHATIAHIRGAQRVIMVEPSANRLEMSGQRGADILVNPTKEDPRERVQAETGGRGASCVIVACSVAAAQQQSLGLAGRKGRVMLFAGLPEGQSTVELDSNRIHYNEITLYGSRSSNATDCREALALVASGRFLAAQFLTSYVSLDGLFAGIESVIKGEGLKAVVLPNGSATEKQPALSQR
jgi:L-iditol 2-dehydrogenase